MRKQKKDLDESEYDSDSLQLNVDQQSYGEQSITDDSDNVSKTRDQEITKAPEIMGQTERMMRASSKESEKQSSTSYDYTSR